MKANKKFIEGEEAVSAVIGVILMVAITVAIAATVYVYVSGMIGTAPETTPSLQMQQNQVGNSLLVATADPTDLAWSDINITVDRDYAWINATWLASGSQGYSGEAAPGTWGDVKAGNRIVFTANPVNVTLRYVPTNTLLGSYTFT